MGKRNLMMALAAALGGSLLLMESGFADDVVSLHDFAWTEQHSWVAPFDYKRVMGRAQRQDVVVYSMEMKTRHLEGLRARGLPWVFPTPSADENMVIGYSKGWDGEPRVEPQPIYGYQITDPEAEGPKIRVILVGGNHPREPTGCWALHGMIDFLVSDDPRAEALRRKLIFYVYPAVNPDGKMYLESKEHHDFINVNGSPELAAIGATNHNRMWNTDGKVHSIDTIKAAMIKDTGGRADYLLDFHGIPRRSFVFACEETAPVAPLSLAFGSVGKGMTQRTGGAHPGMLRSWAMSGDGLDVKYAFTPEIANLDKKGLFEEGRFFALAFHEAVTGNAPESPGLRIANVEPRKPARPAAAWLFAGNAEEALARSSGGTASDVDWSEETRFEFPGNRAVRLSGENGYVDFGQSQPDVNSKDALTVALWVRGHTEPEGLRYLVSRYNPSSDQRSWALAQRGGTREFTVVLSSDGSHEPAKIKRFLSTLRPFGDVFDGTWRHVAFTFQGGGEGDLRLFVDGIELLPEGREAHVFNESPVPALHRSSAPLALGYPHGSNRSFEGLIDELSIWDEALSPEEIRWLSINSVREALSP